VKKKKIFVVAGARPNFMKIAPIVRALSGSQRFETSIVHTGQHYDHNMSGSFFSELGIREPDYNLEVGSGSHAFQTATVMLKFEEICMMDQPDYVMVVGDVNSTIAAGLVAKKQSATLVHVEAGLRSGDRLMPEEINRLATDAITDIFFTTEKHATDNLVSSGCSPEQVNFVGNVMIDNLYYQLGRLKEAAVSEQVAALKRKLTGNYICMTMHRPSNVDDKFVLERIMRAVRDLSREVPVIFPCHPRSRKNIAKFGFDCYLSDTWGNGQTVEKGLICLPPLGYNDFLYLWKDASLVITDSGGLQEETTALEVPCLTIRENTERPVTVEVGSNLIVGTDGARLKAESRKALEGQWKACAVPELWDGRTGERIKTILEGTCDE
jgi:UDP-N-acetylglucosamine 2-epimerase (non-hydrolysing)